MRRSPDTNGLARIAAGVRRLSQLLTRERDGLPEAYLRDPELRAAYQAYFLPANLPKVRVPLGELACHPSGLLPVERLRTLDIGSGPGTSLLGVMDFFRGSAHRPELELTAVDPVQGNLRDCASLVEQRRASYGRRVELRTQACAAEQATAKVQGRFDLIILSNVLNELFPAADGRVQRRARLVDDILRGLLDERGSCIIIEPALRETSRDLLGVRDGSLAAGHTIYSPCLVGTPCPALRSPKDWCHEDRSWDAPEDIAAIDRMTGLRKDSLKFSYLVLRRDSASLADVAGADAYRAVSAPLVTRGKREYYLCGPGGRRLVVRLDKDAAPQNGPYDELERGALVRFTRLVDEQHRLRITKETTVTILPLPSACCGKPYPPV